MTSHLDAKLGVRKKRVGATRQQTEPDKIRVEELPPTPVGIIVFRLGILGLGLSLIPHSHPYPRYNTRVLPSL